MRIAILLLIAVYTLPGRAVDCISAVERQALLKKIKTSVVQIDTPNGDEGSGFLLKSSRGTELVTAHHVVDDRKGDGEGCDASVGPSQGLLVPKVNFQKGQPRKMSKPKFNHSAEDVSVHDDIAKTKLDGLKYKTLEAESSDRLPELNEEIIIGGHPLAKSEVYTQHNCKFIGFGSGVASDKHPNYILRCTAVNYDVAGMSGGVAISACSGKVIGALSAQDYAGDCDKRGDKTIIAIAPLSQNSLGEIKFGLPKPASPAVCWYEDKEKGRTTIQHLCDVSPGNFPAVNEPALRAPATDSALKDR